LYPVLLADLGGTTSRFALGNANGGVESVIAMPNEDLPGPAAAISHFLTYTGARPQSGVLAVAGPVEGDEIALTNRAWRFRLSELAREFGLARLHAINDFEAVAWSLFGLGPDAVQPIGPLATVAPGPRVVCGPGTGLGAAALMPVEGKGRGSWRVVATEAGHMSFGPSCDAEEPVFARLRAMGALSAESVLSGPGLVRLHQALNPGAEPLIAEAIAQRARDGGAECVTTVTTFVRLLGRFAGDLALTFKAGTVYLAGGVAGRLMPLVDAKVFREGFEAHPPHDALMACMPSFVITEPEPGLIGCAVVAQEMLRSAPAVASVRA
jgi:glucokinase